MSKAVMIASLYNFPSIKVMLAGGPPEAKIPDGKVIQYLPLNTYCLKSK